MQKLTQVLVGQRLRQPIFDQIALEGWSAFLCVMDSGQRLDQRDNISTARFSRIPHHGQTIGAHGGTNVWW
jgi:hypothetical protein